MWTKEKLKKYQNDIISWAEENVYLASKSGNQKLELWPFQKEILKECTQKRDDGSWKYQAIIFCFPKRNGKTFLATLFLAWEFTCFYNIKGVVASNTEDQASSVVFDEVKGMIQRSPELLEIVGPENILDKEIRLPATESRIVCLSGNRVSAWGLGVNIGVVDEIHAAPNGKGLYDILASQTGDRKGHIILPSQSSGRDNILYTLYKLSEEKEDESIYFKYIHDENPSPFIEERWLKSRKKQLLPSEYEMYHLNHWGSSSQALFNIEQIDACLTDEITAPVGITELEELKDKYKTNLFIGAGLDRAMSFSKHGDRTIWTVVGAVNIENRIVYFILDQRHLKFSTDDEIKEAILWAKNEYGYFQNIVFESYQCLDINHWAKRQNFQVELVTPTASLKREVFTYFYNVIDANRLKIPKKGLPQDINSGKSLLENELITFEHEITGGNIRFGHPSGSTIIKDDAVDSTAYAIYSLREFIQKLEILNNDDFTLISGEEYESLQSIY